MSYTVFPSELTHTNPRKPQKEDDVPAFDEDYKQHHLWRVSADERVEERITEGDYSILGYRFSLDGSRIALHRAPTPLFDDSDESEVWVMDANGEDAARLTDNAVVERGAELSPDNAVVLFRTDSNEDFETYYNGNLFVVNATGGEPRLLLSDLPHGIDDASWSADGKSIYFTANTGVRRELFAVDVTTEKLTQLTNGDHAVRSWTYVPKASRHVFSIGEPTNPGNVWTLDASREGRPKLATDVFGYVSKDFVLPRQEAIQWKGADGVTVEGLLFYPLDYQPGQRYPLVVQTHGGPASSDKFGFPRWRDYIPVLAAKGYAVLKPNYRGSTGYGDPFLRDMVGHYYQNAHLDVMAGVDHVIELGIADGERMAKMGWSGGDT